MTADTTINGEKSMRNSSSHDVMIAGAGPVGLFLACELALAQCSVLVLEKAEDRRSPHKHMPFGIRGLSAPTIEALDRRGLLGELELHKRLKNPHQNAGEGSRRQVGHFAGIPFLEGDVDRAAWPYRLASSTQTSLISEMSELEEVLTRRAEVLGVEIKRGISVTGFDQNDNAVVVHCSDRSFEAGWLVGCDGARSAVRKAGGIAFAGTEPTFTGYSTQVDLADPKKLAFGRNLTAKGMYLQSQPGFIILQDFDEGSFHDSEKPITREHVQEVLRRISETDVTLTALHAATTWTDRARQATTYRNGRVLLAGDAAHIHAPLGGQGLNLGLGDAMNLGWKLAATIKKNAPQHLLTSYQNERHPIGMQVLDWSRAQVAIMKPTPEARALNAIVRDLMTTRDGATYFAARVWGIFTHYDLGGVHPLVGQSAPNFGFDDGVTLGERMHDGKGMLLDFGQDASLKTWALKYVDRINYVSRQAIEPLGLTAVLIRPDGIVAWACDGDPDSGELEKAAARWALMDS